MPAGFTRRAILGGIGAAATLPMVALRAASLEKIRSAGVLRIAVYRDFAPWAWDDGGTLRGIDVELGTAIAQKLGVKAEFRDFLAGDDVDDDLRNMVWKGPATGGMLSDIMMHAPFDRTFALRNDRVVIVAPYYRESFAIGCSRDLDCEDPPVQFKGHKIAVELNSIPDFYMSGQFGGALRSDVVHMTSGMVALDSVRDGKSDLAMATRAQVEHALSKGGDVLVARKGPIPALTSPGWDIGLAVKDDSRDLGDRLETLLPEMITDKTVPAIFARYGVTLRAPLAS
ncbi:ABC-type amino acid transport substrate-binding protein [Sphingomonas sp. BE137]|jgi:ABC-type amino acid transport substrate-binding protein|uniref:Transporter substrate-binding domain-containing protein n=2 Tax=Sphingomonadaceae TaxID=41297 RepID=A0ABU4PQA8_9SPHN|nr:MULTISPECIES: transporter substrate-binding domain-containing protein [Sphingomonas]MDR6850413.1 ABC-type amino acid transport substrate-binding protein [Sphingomonas sp. BE137]MDX5986326.1 transporter substrate-binding domain-containing protein [Sphingomonas echinoides]